MRYSGDWMTLVDDRILEYVRENGSGSPTEMQKNAPIRYSRPYVHKRCKELTKRGLLEHLGNGVYVITDDGEAYLDGELDTQTMQYLDEEESKPVDSGEGVNS